VNGQSGPYDDVNTIDVLESFKASERCAWAGSFGRCSRFCGAKYEQFSVWQPSRTQTLPREDNIWGGYDHQPTQSEVTRQEKSAGIAASRQDEQLANDEVERIYDRLMRKTVARS
jgi:hypothetical protein